MRKIFKRCILHKFFAQNRLTKINYLSFLSIEKYFYVNSTNYTQDLVEKRKDDE